MWRNCGIGTFANNLGNTTKEMQPQYFKKVMQLIEGRL
jgi:hypothetical protein